jgi:transposase
LPDLDNISKEALYIENVALKSQITDFKNQVADLKFQLSNLTRAVFGQTRERFVPAVSPQQASLFTPPQTMPTEVILSENKGENKGENTEKKKGQAAGKANPNHNGRNAFPAHLPREVVVLTPQAVSANPDDFSKIGQEITETLDYTPAKLFVRQYVREKYAVGAQKLNQDAPNESMTEGVVIAPMPERPLPKAIAEAGLLAQVMVDKYVDHLPVDRQAKRWKRESGIDISGSTVVGWQLGVQDLLMPLYEKLTDTVFECEYLQADESTMKCLENASKGKSHMAYQWVYRNVEKGLIVFDYQRGRGGDCLHPKVKTHQGFLQTDGYVVYDALEGLPNLRLMNCLAHARREFFDAQQNDPENAAIALDFIQKCYKIEDDIAKEGLGVEHIKQRRQEKTVPILTDFKVWLEAQTYKVLPKSPIGKAIAYTLNRWDKLTLFVTDGRLEMDNNRLENAIRPLALGRKNYLFAGSDEGGKRAAMMYSLFACCKLHNINPREWLADVLQRLPTHPINKIEYLLPHLWVKAGG